MPAVPKAGHVVAVAGRRVDPDPSGTRRFPFDRVADVERAFASLVDELGVSALVTSAACGADLVALKVAADRGIPARIVLPSEEEKFKASSVLDRPRPEYWRALFETSIAAARARGGLVVLAHNQGGAESYSAGNRAIIDIASSLAQSGDTQPVAVLIWEGRARDGVDATDEFRKLAEAAGFSIRTISTT